MTTDELIEALEKKLSSCGELYRSKHGPGTSSVRISSRIGKQGWRVFRVGGAREAQSLRCALGHYINGVSAIAKGAKKS